MNGGITLDSSGVVGTDSGKGSSVASATHLGLRFTTLSDAECRKIAPVRLRFLFDILGKRHLNSELARRLGVSRMRLSRWARGETVPDGDHRAVIAAYVAEAMFAGRPDVQAAFISELVRWLSGAGLSADDDAKIRRVIVAQLVDAPNEIKALRQRLGLGSTEAARLLGITRQWLHNWEKAPATAERLDACQLAWTTKQTSD